MMAFSLILKRAWRSNITRIWNYAKKAFAYEYVDTVNNQSVVVQSSVTFFLIR